MKKQISVLIVSVAVIIICSGYLVINNYQKNNARKISLVFIDDPNIQYKSSMNPLQLIKSTNADDIKFPIIKTDIIGEQSLLYIAKNDDGTAKNFIFKINVIDKTIPILTLHDDTVTIKKGDNFDFTKMISESYDEVDGKLIVKCDDKYDVNVPGEYLLNLYNVDAAKNKTIANLKLIVEDIQQPELINEENKELNENELDLNETTNAVKQPIENKSYVKRWLFSEGYTAKTAMESCVTYGKEKKNSAYCFPIQDSQGIYIGYELQ
ncbi:MAG: hypothetical protein RR646_04285 [Erysipelotrichaceae bacterium]